MKTFLTLSIAALLFGFTLTTAQQNDFILKTDKDTITINAGDSTVFNLNIMVQNGFDASIFLSVSSEMPIYLSTSIVNAPYLGVKLTVKTNKTFTKHGFYGIVITGTNGQMISRTVCYVKVVKDSTNWRIVPMGFSMPGFIVQDVQGNYWHNRYSIDETTSALFKESKDNLLENWSSNEYGAGGRLEIPPVIDNKNSRIWLATKEDGVIRQTLDFKNKTIFNTSNSPILSNRITDIAIDSNGATWIGTSDGLARLTGANWTVFDSTNSVLTTERITNILVSGSIIWIGTINGLVKFDGTTWKRFNPQNSGMPAPCVWRISAETNGELWMGLSNDTTKTEFYVGPNTMVGIAKFDGVNWSLYTYKNSPLGRFNYISSISRVVVTK